MEILLKTFFKKLVYNHINMLYNKTVIDDK